MSTSVACITDSAIPTLRAVLDPLELRGFLPCYAKGIQELQVRVLRHHPGKRCVVEAACQTAEGPYSWIGKVYAQDYSHVYRLMEEVQQAGFGPQEEFSIPEPTAYIPELQLLLQEKVSGRPATDLFLSDQESERTTAAERCACWLATYHRVAPRMGPSLSLGDQMVSMERWYRRLASLGEPFAGKAEELFKRLEAAAPKLQAAETRTIHGSYTHHQMIHAPGRTVTFDWDDYAVADQSQDVARFIVGLQRLALRCFGSIHALDDAAEIFRNVYSSRVEPEATANLRFYRAAVCLRLAKKDIRHQTAGWYEKAEATLDEGLRVLSQSSYEPEMGRPTISLEVKSGRG